MTKLVKLDKVQASSDYLLLLPLTNILQLKWEPGGECGKSLIRDFFTS